MIRSPTITTFLWFDDQAEEAVEFYLSVFPNSKRLGSVKANGKVLTVQFELNGQAMTALNGGPRFQFTEAISFAVHCETQEQIDEYWQKLSAGGSEGQCGWLKDRFGLSWQVVPTRLGELLRGPGAMKAMMGMKKLDIRELERGGQA